MTDRDTVEFTEDIEKWRRNGFWLSRDQYISVRARYLFSYIEYTPPYNSPSI
jgi:hypothetical protein